jgi:hypothetical protein
VYIISKFVMKKTLLTLTVAALFAFSAPNANAGWFGASLGKSPSVTLFGQTLTVPIPSVTLGSAAGTSVSASASSDKGVSASLPFVKVSVKSPSLTVGTKSDKVKVSANGVEKTKK